MATRCPFCHEGIAAAADDAIHCAGCDAIHHAECFVESEGCATECRTSRARVGHTEVSLRGLADVLARGGLAEVAARAPGAVEGRLSAYALSLLTGFFGAALLGPLIEIVLWKAAVMPGGLGLGVLLGGALGWLIGWRLAQADPSAEPQPLTLRQEPTESFDPFLGQWRTDPHAVGVPPDPLGPIRPALDAAGTTPPATGPTPDTCPWCKEDLEAEDDDPLSFCYHCGGQLTDVSGDLPAEPDAADHEAAPPGRPAREPES